jgi:hypothetical protein
MYAFVHVPATCPRRPLRAFPIGTTLCPNELEKLTDTGPHVAPAHGGVDLLRKTEKGSQRRSGAGIDMSRRASFSVPEVE